MSITKLNSKETSQDFAQLSKTSFVVYVLDLEEQLVRTEANQISHRYKTAHEELWLPGSWQKVARYLKLST